MNYQVIERHRRNFKFILPSERKQSDYILYDSNCMIFLKRQNYGDGKIINGCLGLGRGRDE